MRTLYRRPCSFGLLWFGLAVAVTLTVPRVACAENTTEKSYRAGLRYEMGHGTPVDFGLAYVHYCRSARAGHVGAALRLSILADHGAGIERDAGLAAGWLRRAAVGGDAMARHLLARFEGVPEKIPHCRLPEDGNAAARMTNGESVRRDIERLVRSQAPALGLDPALVLAVIQVESGFEATAVSPKGAVGLMQILPETGRRFGLEQPFVPSENVRAGMEYLRWLMTYFNGDVVLALAGYNAGENAVVRFRGVPPYRETRNYVARVMELYSKMISSDLPAR